MAAAPSVDCNDQLCSEPIVATTPLLHRRACTSRSDDHKRGDGQDRPLTGQMAMPSSDAAACHRNRKHDPMLSEPKNCWQLRRDASAGNQAAAVDTPPPKGLERREPMLREGKLAEGHDGRVAKSEPGAIQRLPTARTRDEVNPRAKLNAEIQKKKAGAA